MEIPPLKVKDLPSEASHVALAAVIKEAKSYHLGFIFNTFKELEGSFLDQFSRSLPCIPIYPIGPLHKYSSTCTDRKLNEDHSSMINWLNTQAPNSVLYVSFGTIAAINKEQFAEIAWGLAKSKQPFLWVVRSKLVDGAIVNDDIYPEDFLQTISGRGYIVTWAPQREVLAHPSVGGFWSHCGWNSTIESICEGVPMICLPFFGDQKMNTLHVSDVLRVGLRLEKELERQEIECAIRRLMVEEEGEEMRERIAALKEKAHSCLMEGGSSFKAMDQLTDHILSFLRAEKPRR